MNLGVGTVQNVLVHEGGGGVGEYVPSRFVWLMRCIANIHLANILCQSPQLQIYLGIIIITLLTGLLLTVLIQLGHD